ncbi:hypothetical protein [Marinobacterium aestuariivivens]|uniref:Uncharacterized protein n=1 Tax=Marinobacterium aestuariivivens TaxID=1698799 RepID=A0ABW2A6Z9_9GAMM
MNQSYEQLLENVSGKLLPDHFFVTSILTNEDKALIIQIIYERLCRSTRTFCLQLVLMDPAGIVHHLV